MKNSGNLTFASHKSCSWPGACDYQQFQIFSKLVLVKYLFSHVYRWLNHKRYSWQKSKVRNLVHFSSWPSYDISAYSNPLSQPVPPKNDDCTAKKKFNQKCCKKSLFMPQPPFQSLQGREQWSWSWRPPSSPHWDWYSFLEIVELTGSHHFPLCSCSLSCPSGLREVGGVLCWSQVIQPPAVLVEESLKQADEAQGRLNLQSAPPAFADPPPLPSPCFCSSLPGCCQWAC